MEVFHMENAKKYFRDEDEEHIVMLRHEFHRHPELETDLPETCAIVEKELSDLGIPYSLRYAKSGIVGYINYPAEGYEEVPGKGMPGHVFTIGLRADMDALPITEATGLPYSSTHPGIMHACGHDAHTAMLLGAARALKRAEKEGVLKIRIKLFFQPNEEGKGLGAGLFVESGALSDVDLIFGQHISNDVPTGELQWHRGPFQAACFAYTILFRGRSSHATTPQLAHDALGMAVKAVNDIYLMNSREISPFKNRIISVGSLHAGTAHNIIASEAEIQISFRFYDDDVRELVDRRIRQICKNAAEELSGEVEITLDQSADPVINDDYATDKVIEAQRMIVPEEKISEAYMRMGSEDFSFYQRVCPGSFSRIGTGNPEKGCTGSAHNADLVLDEAAFLTGAMYLAQLGMLEYN